MTRPLDSAAVWRGTELFERPDWLHTLRPVEVSELDRLLSTSGDEWSPGSLGGVLARIQNSLETGSGAALLRGLPVDRYSTEEACRIFSMIARKIGTPVSQDADGSLVFSVRDEGFGENDPRTRGPNTRKRLSFHTDRCDVIAFLCLRRAKSGGESFIVSSATLYNEVSSKRPDLLDVLTKPFYYRRHNVDTGNELPYCRQPVFSFWEGHFAASFLRVLIERAHAMPELPDMTALEREALDYLEMLAAKPSLHVSFLQEPGDILLLNNWVTFHRRSEFEDHEDPALRRHLLRIWLAVPNSRPLHPAFEANYGCTAAGSIRGGMRRRV